MTTRRSVRKAWLALVVAPVLILAACIPDYASTLNTTRRNDPVVITGAQVPALIGAVPGDIVAFKYSRFSGQWAQVPVQVDERKVLNFGTVYHSTANNVNVLGYADPGTWAGADSNPALDADDEIAFMAGDAEGKPASFAEPVGVVPGSGVEVTVTDPRAPGTRARVYLFRRSAPLSPGAGRQYVSYSFSLNSGAYLSTYKLADGPNPENSLVTGETYTHHFGDRWLSDRLTVNTGGATGVDILDRHKALFGPGVCGRSEDTFNDAEGAFIVNKSGPVRAIRSYIGANSGPNSQREHVFYRDREEIRTFLRVHAIPGIMDFFDYSPAASGMTYSNNLNTGGVPVNGIADTLVAGAPEWEKIAGPQGSLTHVNQLATNFANTSTNYYLDSTAPPVTQCTGDAVSYGASGSWITSAIPCTEPATACTNTLKSTRWLFFEAPGRSTADATRHRDDVYQPLQVATSAWTS